MCTAQKWHWMTRLLVSGVNCDGDYTQVLTGMDKLGCFLAWSSITLQSWKMQGHPKDGRELYLTIRLVRIEPGQLSCCGTFLSP